jgi:hypothetical protein
MQAFYNLPEATKTRIFEQISARTPLPAYAIEKDWWVVQTLRIVFGMEVGKHLIFKGGTSLSKALKLIDRFSEDIDLVIDKEAIGIDEIRTKKQVKALRSKSKEFLTIEFIPLLEKAFIIAGFDKMKFKIPEDPVNDPISIEIQYPYIAKYPGYILPRVLIEIGSRSLIDPFVERTITSFVTEQFPDQDFADVPVKIPTATPERTFLEKIFLLHEEYQKGEIRVNRLTRHLYDLERIMDTPYGNNALKDYKLYQNIVEHRKLLFSVNDVDYSLHQPQLINLVPPDKVLKDWEKDYKDLSENMIYGEKLPWNDLVERIKALTDRINSLDFTIEIE